MIKGVRTKLDCLQSDRLSELNSLELNWTLIGRDPKSKKAKVGGLKVLCDDGSPSSKKTVQF